MSVWDAERYEGRHSYVWNFGASLVDLLDPQPGERILDLGCGTGHLTSEIAARGATTIGLDSAPAMIGQARQNYPRLEFTLADATRFSFAEPFDAVFSNAVLHWVQPAEQAANCIAASLKPGGRFVAEFGGKGNVASVQAALAETDIQNPWYFPSVGEYASLLEKCGLQVTQAILFDRPTALEGEDGMEDWIRMYCGPHLAQDIAARLRPILYRDGVWTVDYRRLRIVARK